MPLTFAICLFFVAGLGEVLRRGDFGMSPLATVAVLAAAMCLFALAILRRDAINLIRSPGRALYTEDNLGWSWQRTIALAFFVPFLWGISAACASIFTSYVVVVPAMPKLASALAIQVLIFALPQDLFFREAVLKVFHHNLTLAFAASAIAVTLFNLPHGMPTAVIAAGTATAFMALRVAGMNIFVVALAHGATNVLFGRVLLAEISADALWLYAIVFAGAHLLFAALLMLIRQPVRSLMTQRAS